MRSSRIVSSVRTSFSGCLRQSSSEEPLQTEICFWNVKDRTKKMHSLSGIAERVCHLKQTGFLVVWQKLLTFAREQWLRAKRIFGLFKPAVFSDPRPQFSHNCVCAHGRNWMMASGLVPPGVRLSAPPPPPPWGWIIASGQTRVRSGQVLSSNPRPPSGYDDKLASGHIPPVVWPGAVT